jgi:hypothetical protein
MALSLTPYLGDESRPIPHTRFLPLGCSDASLAARCAFRESQGDSRGSRIGKELVEGSGLEGYTRQTPTALHMALVSVCCYQSSFLEIRLQAKIPRSTPCWAVEMKQLHAILHALFLELTLSDNTVVLNSRQSPASDARVESRHRREVTTAVLSTLAGEAKMCL